MLLWWVSEYIKKMEDTTFPTLFFFVCGMVKKKQKVVEDEAKLLKKSNAIDLQLLAILSKSNISTIELRKV